MNLESIQQALKAESLDGWLFYDHHRRDPLAYRILGLPDTLNPTRRWFYFIPATGEPRALAHRIEPHSLDALPGSRRLYSRWAELTTELQTLLKGATRIAMQHSTNNAVPYVGMVDSGTVDFVRSLGLQVETSANLVQLFEARWTDAQFASHMEAGRRVDTARAAAFRFIRERLASNAPTTEWDVHQFLHEQFRAANLFTDHGPIVAVNANASNPHYEPTQEQHSPIIQGDLVLLDMWGKLNEPDAVYYDITWTGYCGSTPPDRTRQVFDVVTTARDRGIDAVLTRAASGLQGYEVDDAVRSHIEQQGFGEYFIHRTGHSIGTNVHGAGANMDNFETHDERRIIPRTCFSIEPGVYLPEFGIRSEVDMYIGEDKPLVTGEIQRELVILA